MNVIAIPLLLFVAGADDKPPTPKLPLGKDTTYFIGPFDKYGYIDYEAALNAELSKGITPEKNANVLIVQALGPAPEGGDGMLPVYYKWLEMPMPPKEGEYFVGQDKFLNAHLGLTMAQRETFYKVQGRATQRPWEAKDCPPLAEWLKLNEKPMAIVLEAVKRPQYFNPLFSRRQEGESSNLIGCLLPTVQKCRDLATAFTARAMLRLKEGKFDDAWQDIIACHRLGRLVSRGVTMIEALVSIAICQIASNATLTYLEHADLTSKQVLERLKDIQALPPMAKVADKIDTGERMMGLDVVQMVRRGGGQELGLIFETPSEDELKALKIADWASVMQTMNKWYDRVAVVLRMTDRAAREKELDKFEEEFASLKSEFADQEKLKKILKEKDADKVIGKALGNSLVRLLMSAFRRVQQAHDRIEQVSKNLEVAFALAAYRKDNDRYPAKLADLAPKYLKAIPTDLFAGKPLIYKPNAQGYLFYSVGVNGKDDGGRSSDDPPGDDLGVTMPLPELKK